MIKKSKLKKMKMLKDILKKAKNFSYIGEESWRSVKGFGKSIQENYLISSHGFVYSVVRNNFLKGSINNSKGYERVSLTIKYKKKTLSVARLVALAFIPNPQNKPQVNHKDLNKLNNQVSNLEWMTNKENEWHRADNGKLKPENVKKIREMYLTGKYSQRQLAREYNISQSMIWAIIHRKFRNRPYDTPIL